MKLLITGGHMAPALSVIEQLPKDIEVIYVGRMHPFEKDRGVSLEYQTLTKKGIRFIPLTTGRIQRKLTLHTLPILGKIPQGFWEAYQILSKEKPDVVLGFGGYLSVPIGIVASLLTIPLVIHEQTLSAGLANKVLSRFAQAICISWESSRKFFPKNKTVLTGNPLLPSLKSAPESLFPVSKEHLPLLFIVGGSGGSHALNALVEESLDELLLHYRILQQTGDAQEFRDFDRLTKKRQELPQQLQKRYALTKFIAPSEIADVYKKADLVISRSGINTVTTLLLLKKMALLIALPFGQHNEQQENAEMFASVGLGEILPQQTATSSRFLTTIAAMIEKKTNYTLKKSIVIPQDSAKRIIDTVTVCSKSKVSKNEKRAISFEK